MLPTPCLPRNNPAASRATTGPPARHQSQPKAISAYKPTPAMQSDDGCRQVPCLPGKSAAASLATKRLQAGHKSLRSAFSATHATQSEAGCRQGMPRPRLPPKKWRVIMGDKVAPSTPPEPAQCHIEAPRRPCKVMTDAPKRHACHATVPQHHGRLTGPKRAARASPGP